MKKYIKLVAVFFFTATFSSCTLGLQDNFEFKSEGLPDVDPFENMTAWEFIQTRTTQSVKNSRGKWQLRTSDAITNSTGNSLDLMIEAIKKLGLEELYNAENSKGKTFILLSNRAFAGNNTNAVVRLCTGRQLSTSGLYDGVTDFDKWTPDQLNMLKAVLLYHIVDDKITQFTIPTFNFFINSKTLLRDVDTDASGAITGLSSNFTEMSFSRLVDARNTMVLNEVGSDLPESATVDNNPVNVARHNYVFKNGIGHYVNSIARNRDFESYRNLTID